MERFPGERSGSDGTAVVDLGAGGHAEVDFELRHASRISGWVLDASGAGAGGASVHLIREDGGAQRWTRQVEAGADGAFGFDELEEGRYWIVAARGTSIGGGGAAAETRYPVEGGTIALGKGDRVENITIPAAAPR